MLKTLSFSKQECGKRATPGPWRSFTSVAHHRIFGVLGSLASAGDFSAIIEWHMESVLACSEEFT
ncbi:hypothetical protein LVJ94_03025 [Pendulispora rubella]|uniref:Uncharacterized protein n=1 Tax=Pendulispora rubella TaxID=2741070 RepID=A0ABZ2L5J6_9BACT